MRSRDGPSSPGGRRDRERLDRCSRFIASPHRFPRLADRR